MRSGFRIGLDRRDTAGRGTTNCCLSRAVHAKTPSEIRVQTDIPSDSVWTQFASCHTSQRNMSRAAQVAANGNGSPSQKLRAHEMAPTPFSTRVSAGEALSGTKCGSPSAAVPRSSEDFCEEMLAFDRHWIKVSASNRLHHAIPTPPQRRG